MAPKTYRSKLLNLKITMYLTPILAFMLEIDRTEGIKWINTPSQITKCAGETAHLRWEYVKDNNEDIRQLQWRFNTTTTIAYRAMVNGLHIEEIYKGRVEESGVNGILLKNISAKDTGNYSLYIYIAWDVNPVLQSIWLNVVDKEVTISQWCTCKRLPIFPYPEWNGGKTVKIMTEGCALEINASYCCIKEPSNRCVEKDPHMLCFPIGDPTNRIVNVNESRITDDLTKHATQNTSVREDAASAIRHMENFALSIANVYLPMINATMLFFLCVCGVLWLFDKTSQVGLFRRRNRKRSDFLEDSLFPLYEESEMNPIAFRSNDMLQGVKQDQV